MNFTWEVDVRSALLVIVLSASACGPHAARPVASAAPALAPEAPLDCAARELRALGYTTHAERAGGPDSGGLVRAHRAYSPDAAGARTTLNLSFAAGSAASARGLAVQQVSTIAQGGQTPERRAAEVALRDALAVQASCGGS